MVGLRRDVAATSTDPVTRIAELHANGMPAAVLFSGREVSERVLLAEFVGDGGGRGVEVLRIAHDLGPSSAVIGQVAQRSNVDRVAASGPRATLRRKRRKRRRPRGQWATARREGKWPRKRAAPLELRSLQAPAGIPLAVDPNGIEEGLALPNQLLRIATASFAGGVIAIGKQDEGLLAILPGGRQAGRLGDRIVHRRAAVSADPAERLSQQLSIRSPGLHEDGTVVEAVQKDLIPFVEQLEEEPVQGSPRRANLLAGHAAAGIEDDAETDRHTLGIEIRQRLDQVVLVDDEVFPEQSRYEPPGRIEHHGGDVDQLDAALEPESRIGILRRRWLPGVYGDDDERGGERDRRHPTNFDVGSLP